MYLDARTGDVGWDIWDVARCARPRFVVWVDSEAATWGGWHAEAEALRSLMFGHDPPTHRERRITVYPARRLILFNEVDDRVTDEVDSRALVAKTE